MKLNNFNDLFFFTQSEALQNIINQPIDYVYRKICRIYSREFNTPLHTVYSLPARIVILNVLEDRFEQMEDEQLLEHIIRTIDPDIDKKNEKELEEWIEKVEKEEKEKHAAKHQKANPSTTQAPIKQNKRQYDFSDEEKQLYSELIQSDDNE